MCGIAYQFVAVYHLDTFLKIQYIHNSWKRVYATIYILKSLKIFSSYFRSNPSSIYV
jgi:hypothetical protein